MDSTISNEEIVMIKGNLQSQNLRLDKEGERKKVERKKVGLLLDYKLIHKEI